MSCGALIGLAGLTLSAAGAGAGEVAASNEQSAMNDQVSAELARQQALQKQGNTVFQQSLASSTPASAAQQIQSGQQQALGATKTAQAAPLSLAAAPQAGNTDDQKARQGLENQANAGFMGYGNYGLQQQLKDLSVNSQLGVIGNQSQQDASLLSPELQAASRSDSGLAALGSLLGTVGGLTGLANSAGLFGGAANPATTAAINNSWNGANILGQQGPSLYLGSVAPQPSFANLGFIQ